MADLSDVDGQIGRIVGELEATIRGNQDIMERTNYLILISQILLTLKTGIGGLIAQYYQDTHADKDLALNFTDGYIGVALFKLFQEVFLILEESPNSYGYEYRAIDGCRLEDVDAINLSELGIPVIMPKSLEVDERPGRVVTLSELDKVRMQEWQAIGAMAYEDSSKRELVQRMLSSSDGIPTGPIFS